MCKEPSAAQKLMRDIARLRQIFAEAIRETGYAGQFHYAYTSKANAAEEVVRTAVASLRGVSPVSQVRIGSAGTGGASTLAG